MSKHSNHSHETSMLPFLIGAFCLFIIGVFGTVFLPFLDDQMTEPNRTAEMRLFEEGTAEYRGRQIYIREGCHTCHTQTVRPVKADSGLGPVSAAQDFYYDFPNLMGTKRTGADLTWVGTRWNEDWHREHLLNSSNLLPGSIMPRYDYLSDDDIEDLIAYLMSLRPAPSTEARDQ